MVSIFLGISGLISRNDMAVKQETKMSVGDLGT